MKQKMSREERKRKVKELIAELDRMREEYRDVGLHVNAYRAFNVRPTSILTALATAGVLGISFLVDGFIDGNTAEWSCALTFLIVVGIVFCLCWRKYAIIFSDIKEITYGRRSIELLEEKVAKAKKKIKKYQEECRRLSSVIERFNKLEPIIIDELSGKFKLDTHIGKFKVNIEVDNRSVYDDISESSYVATLNLIEAARSDLEKALELEKKVLGTNTDEELT